MTKTASTYSSQMRSIYQRFVDQKRGDGEEVGPVNLNEVFDFAYGNGLWIPPNQDARRRFRRDLAQALREDYFIDECGRSVRRYHAATSVEFEDGHRVQKSFWDDIDTADRGHMEVAIQQRRQHIVGECCQLNNDVNYYNEHHPGDSPFQLLLDFTYDVADREQPMEYKPNHYED